jgi:SAM-dependent methyltransferase
MADHEAEPLEAVLRRLKEEREQADARYNDALTAVDRALNPPAAIPQPLPTLDDHQIAALNDAWNILPARPEASGTSLRQRTIGFIWGVIGPYLQRQLTFNSLLVDHINRNAARAHEAQQASERTADVLREQLAALANFQAKLIQYFQQFTAYVDTKDRDTAGRSLVLNASLSGLADTASKRWESMSVGEQRVSARMDTLTAAHDDLRNTIGTLQQGLMTIKRELERMVSAGGGTSGPGSRTDPGGVSHSSAPDAFSPALDAYKYVGFEDRFRGSRDTIRQRLESYLPLFDGKMPVLDVGCGRGEFLDLLTARHIDARGIDLNHEMAEACRARGLNVTEADAVGHLSTLADGTLGGIFSAQVVEHLQPAYLLRLLELSFHKLRPGGRLVLETLNPACWVAFFDSYIRDITHVWPLHPDTLKYLVTASGFSSATVEFRSPVPEEDRLQAFAAPAGGTASLADLAEAFNANVEKLNARMFTYLDYAVIGDKAS